MYRQVVLPTHFHVFIEVIAVREEVESLDDRPVGGVLERDDGVVSFLLLKGRKGIGEGDMRKQVGRSTTEGLGGGLRQQSEQGSLLSCGVAAFHSYLMREGRAGAQEGHSQATQ